MTLIPVMQDADSRGHDRACRRQHPSRGLIGAHHAQGHHRFFAEEQVPRPAGDRWRWCSAAAFALRNIPLDAIPDLSDTQVIIYTEWPGQAPQIVQDQVTYPITTKMLSVPKAKVVRGYSFYGFSFVYVIFEDGTDPYWARSRVLEYLSGLASQLPKNVTPTLGPDATGVGWAFMYSLNSKERRPRRAAFDAGLVSAIPARLRRGRRGGRVGRRLREAIPGHRRSDEAARLQPLDRRGEHGDQNAATAKSAGARSRWPRRNSSCACAATSRSLDDLRKVAVGVGANGVPILLGEVANIQLGPDMRRGIAELNGEGETVGGIVVVRYGANARAGHPGREGAARPGDEGPSRRCHLHASPTTAPRSSTARSRRSKKS